MTKIFNWVKTHKLATVNILFILFVLWIFSPFRYLISGGLNSRSTSIDSMSSEYGGTPLAGSAKSLNLQMPSYEAAPQPDVTDRKVVVNSNFSLLVKDVTDTVSKIKGKTAEMAGYIVNTNIQRAEYSESAVLEIRIPSDKVEQMTEYLRVLSVKVVSENVSGRDITDKYVDVERRISDLERQKTRMQEIMDQAVNVSQMLEIQRALDTIQNQIDNYKGQLIYMEGTTTTSKLTIHLSTDELALPYAPEQPWRPEAVFKRAVRSMLGTAQNIGSAVIWLAVYSPIIIGVIVVVKVIKKLKNRKKITADGK